MQGPQAGEHDVTIGERDDQPENNYNHYGCQKGVLATVSENVLKFDKRKIVL